MDQTIDLLGEAEDGWWRGSVGGRVGMFPSDLVEMVSEDPEEVTRTGDKTVATTVKTEDYENWPSRWKRWSRPSATGRSRCAPP